MGSEKRDNMTARLLPDRQQEPTSSFEISTQSENLDALLTGEASTHFPIVHNRRKDDVKDENVRRLRVVEHALNKGEAFPEDAFEPEKEPLETKFYKQF
jgi:hypothetical protein